MKTNKTKPIKKLMIFTIITVMIVSLFAVPAFADEPQITNLIGTTWRLDGATISGISAEYGVFDVITNGALTVQAVSAEDGSLVQSQPPLQIEATEFACGYISYLNDGFGSIVGKADSVCVYLFDGDRYSYFPFNWYVNIDGLNTICIYEFTITGGTDISNPLFIDFINTYGTLVTSEADEEEQGIFAVWSKITQWIVQGLASVSNAFYADGKLTLLGTLCIIPLALGLAFLLIGIIQKFLRLRG